MHRKSRKQDQLDFINWIVGDSEEEATWASRGRMGLFTKEWYTKDEVMGRRFGIL